MNILIAGGTGFLGQSLIQCWSGNSWQVDILGRTSGQSPVGNHYTWDELAEGKIDIAHYNVVINLCGSSIGDKRWTAQRKQLLFKSRVDPTATLAEICAASNKKPHLICASGVGIYGLQKSTTHALPPAFNEYSPLDTQPKAFISQLAYAWEHAAHVAHSAHVPVTHLRLGVILAKDQGALPKMSLPFHYCIGGPVGDGQQPFSWLSLTDFCRAVDFIIEQGEALLGPVNLVAPHCVRQEELAQSLGHALKRPCRLRTPATLLKLIFGEMAEELLLQGQHVIPSRLLEKGFQFSYPDIDSALESIYKV